MIKYYTYDEMSRLYKSDMEKNEAVNQLILGNIKYIHTLVSKGDVLDENLRFGVIYDNDTPVYYFNNTPPYNMVVMPATPKNPTNPAYYGKVLAEEFNKNGVEISGIQCVYEFGTSFVSSYHKELKQNLAMDIMVATEIQKYPLVGEVYQATMNDFGELCAFYKDFIKEALGSERPMLEIAEQIRYKLSLPNSYIWLYRVDNKLVGMNMSNRQLEHGACVNAVYVVPEERRKGYCKQMVSWASQYYLDHGYEYVTLYVDKTNPYSNAAYAAIGYDYICSVYTFEEE